MSTGITTIESRPGRLPWILSVLLLISAGVAALTAIALPDLIHGPSVMVGSMRGTAVVVAVLAMPILLIGMAASRGRRGVLPIAAWAGSVAFLAYQGWMFLFAVPFNGFFLVYTAMLGFGFWALVRLSTELPFEAYAADFAPSMPVRWLAGWMILSCIAFYGLWLKNVVPASFEGASPAFLEGTGMVTATNYVLDMALFLPFTIASAAMTPAFLVVAAIGVVAFGLWYRGTSRP